MARRKEDENCLIGDHQMQISPSNKFPKESKTVALGVAARRGLKNMSPPKTIGWMVWKMIFPLKSWPFLGLSHP